MNDEIIYSPCDRCPYKQLCRELPQDMSCEDVQKYAEESEGE